MSDTIIKEEIISSLHHRALAHNFPAEDYVSHIKIWEENTVNGEPTDENDIRLRYLLLTSKYFAYLAESLGLI